MNFKLKINGKMLVYVLGTALLIYISTLGYISFKLRGISALNEKESFEAKTFMNAKKIQTQLDFYVETSSITAKAFSNFNTIPEEKRRTLFSEALFNIISNNNKINAISSVWENNAIDNNDNNFINTKNNTETGSFAPAYIRNGDEIKALSIKSSYLNGAEYSKVKESMQEVVSSINSNKQTASASYIAPIVNNNTFYGTLSLELPLACIQDSIKKTASQLGLDMFLISDSMYIVASTVEKQIGKNLMSFNPEMISKIENYSGFKLDKTLNMEFKHPVYKTQHYFSANAIRLGDSSQDWYLILSTPKKALYTSANKTFWLSLSIGLVGLFILSIIIFTISRSITNPLVKTTALLQRLVKGELNLKGKEKSIIKDEIHDITQSINQLINSLSSASDFALQIGNGNLDVKYELLSDNDTLGNALLTMQDSLKKAKIDEDLKRIEDEKRNWVTHGLAKFGEIIRQENNDIKKFSENVIKNLLEYIDAAQGAIYIQTQDEFSENDIESYELQAAMAYGKLIMLTRKVEKGQELIGRAAEENRTIYLENIPEEYAEISPGIKTKEKPRHIIVSPMSINNTIYGVFELLSYNAFEKHHIEFIEKLSENVASVISSVNINKNTAKLLEQSQHQADELAQHEEEMRQNLEEMQATQEEAVKRQASLNSYLSAIKSNLITAELDMQGRIINISPSMSVHYNVNAESVKGKFYEAIVTSDEKSRNEFNEFWVEMTNAEEGKRIQVVNFRNKDHYYIESYHVIQKEGMAQKVIMVAEDKSKEKDRSDLLKKTMNNLG